MSSKPIRELLISYHLPRAPLAYPGLTVSPDFNPAPVKVAQISWDPASNTITPDSALPAWVSTEKLVAKPDQLIKRRGKAGLLKLNTDWPAAKEWIVQRAGKAQQVEAVTGTLNNFIVEPFFPHPDDTEFYVCINSAREGDYILFTHEGGVDVGDVDAKALKLLIPADPSESLPTREQWTSTLLSGVPKAKHQILTDFLIRLYSVYVDLHFAYLEINPLVVTEQGEISYLDMAAKLDQTADFICGPKWAIARDPSIYLGTASTSAKGEDRGPPMYWPAPFGRDLTKEEAYIAKLDAGTGASLKLTVLNAKGRIWTMVAGGGASVVYSDAIAAHGFAHELANYGEYSGAPTEGQTYEYAKTLLDLITRGTPHPEGKLLIIGGGIANFTNVAATFKGIIRALKEYKQALAQHGVRIFVRRGGPNYQEGLRAMRLLGEDLGVEIQVFGPETHITDIVPLALGIKKREELDLAAKAAVTAAPPAATSNGGEAPAPAEAQKPQVNLITGERIQPQDSIIHFDASNPVRRPDFLPFDANTRSLVFGLQPRAIQGMLDFDFSCGRQTPSVAAMIYPFGGHHIQKFYWGTKEVLLPVYTSVEEAVSKHPDADVIVNFASSRSVYKSTLEILKLPQIRAIALIAEGVPERHAREILHRASKAGVLIIGPATVGGIKPGCFRIGNSGGMMDNIISSKLYRAGSVGYVSKSGGMSNELNNILSITTNGTYEGIAIGGDRYPGTTFIDHLLRYEKDPNCKLLVLLGEVGGVEEYRVIDAVKQGIIKKPIVAWAIGTCAKMFTTEVQFGHAGSMANSDSETASAKNQAMKEAGFIVPDTFEDLPIVLKNIYEKLVKEGTVKPAPERDPPNIPIDFKWAQELGMVRKPAAFISTISDERGSELMYSGVKISEVFESNLGIGGVISLLWFKRMLPDYCAKFIEMALMLTADHGPAVSGAMNTIITSRAGKDLVSSLVSGLLTIGDRFGGALDDAAKEFSSAFDRGLTAREYVDVMRKQNRLIPGIGHKIKSVTNPDYRVQVVKDFVLKNFPSHKMLDYALAVERVTTAKKDSLILNVDGCIAVCFVDLLRDSGAFNRDEADEYVAIGTLNGIFTLGRSIGFIGHHLDQKRMKQGLYRHPADDIFIQMAQDTRVIVPGKVAQ
ncbi:hypothetical protein CF326_g1163 [Tilletia indica]|nr:hypothetical protein CF326_g1163 [Tilletia indica]